MMMSRFLCPALLVAASFLVSFRPLATGPAPTAEVREVAVFSGVALATSATVLVRQGSPQQVTVEASAEDLGRLETLVNNGQLTIRVKKEVGWKSFWGNFPHLGKVTVRLTVPAIQRLAVSGSGVLKADEFQTGRLALAVSGSGRLATGPVQATTVRAGVSGSGHLEIAQLRADTLRAATAGSGSITVAGSCPRLSVGISGSGHIRAAGLATETCLARLSGSGGCQVQAARTVEARISGSGSVLVTGPARISSRTSGSGRVRRG
ncbi:head GIN domain-containing protein [Hymenobacter convexus]|uniref:head GIN domain-containing protein n=1 Tax=Hymenobacter sp. CA1UV-4 TaxID=3063782 RepID=UPI0027126238|nr:head GIN domain-containing protein [Hymenobacter sp. CA1UV-4]MDO7852810.1 head GIN domain-containing protein [Hymenobacter sp. CA1UV-4]